MKTIPTMAAATSCSRRDGRAIACALPVGRCGARGLGPLSVGGVTGEMTPALRFAKGLEH
jgi:hypothetical protein